MGALFVASQLANDLCFPHNGLVKIGAEASMLGGSWVVKSGVISRVTIVITHIRGLITPTDNCP